MEHSAEYLRTKKYYEQFPCLHNADTYVRYLNRTGKTPRFTSATAYELFKNDDGQWCIPEHVRELLRDPELKPRKYTRKGAGAVLPPVVEA